MKNIKLIHLDKYNNPDYELVENGIYKINKFKILIKMMEDYNIKHNIPFSEIIVSGNDGIETSFSSSSEALEFLPKVDTYVFAINYELEDNDNSQYPLEDIYERYNLVISDFIDIDAFQNSRIASVELEGELENVRNTINAIVGKRVYYHQLESGHTSLRIE